MKSFRLIILYPSFTLLVGYKSTILFHIEAGFIGLGIIFSIFGVFFHKFVHENLTEVLCVCVCGYIVTIKIAPIIK